MNVYLVQHGEAQPKEVDPDRHLTEKGKRDAEKMAAFLKPLNLRVGTIWHSGKARALETAEILSKGVEAKRGLKGRKDMSPNDAVEPLLRKLRAADEDVMIVGHLPFLTKLASALILGRDDEAIVTFQYAGVVCLERDDERAFAVRWMVTPDVLQ